MGARTGIKLFNSHRFNLYLRLFNCRYEGEDVGEFIADIVVENTVILELKSVT